MARRGTPNYAFSSLNNILHCGSKISNEPYLYDIISICSIATWSAFSSLFLSFPRHFRISLVLSTVTEVRQSSASFLLGGLGIVQTGLSIDDAVNVMFKRKKSSHSTTDIKVLNYAVEGSWFPSQWSDRADCSSSMLMLPSGRGMSAPWCPLGTR